MGDNICQGRSFAARLVTRQCMKHLLCVVTNNKLKILLINSKVIYNYSHQVYGDTTTIRSTHTEHSIDLGSPVQ